MLWGRPPEDVAQGLSVPQEVRLPGRGRHVVLGEWDRGVGLQQDGPSQWLHHQVIRKNIWYGKDALGIFKMNWFYILTHNDKLQTPFRSCQKTYTGGETFASCFSNSAEGFLSEVTWSVSTFLEQDWDVSAPLNSAMTLHISIHREQRRSSSFGSSSSSLLGWCAGSEDWRLCWNMIDIFLLLWLFRIKFQVIISCWSWNFDWYN